VKNALSSKVSVGCCHRSQVRAGEVTMVLGIEKSLRKRTVHRLLSIHLVQHANRRVARARAWARTLLLEIRSLRFRIRDIREKDLVCRYEMGPACQSCQQQGTPQRCKGTHAYIRHMQQLRNLHAWLSYSDMNLLLDGWRLAFLAPDSWDCGISSDLEVARSWQELLGGNSMPPQNKTLPPRRSQGRRFAIGRCL
jgi:hypothetical protein